MRCKLDHASFSLFCPRPWPCTNPSVNLSNIPLLPAIPCFLVIFPFHSWPYASSIVVYGKVVAFFFPLYFALQFEWKYIFIIFEEWVIRYFETIISIKYRFIDHFVIYEFEVRKILKIKIYLKKGKINLQKFWEFLHFSNLKIRFNLFLNKLLITALIIFYNVFTIFLDFSFFQLFQMLSYMMIFTSLTSIIFCIFTKWPTIYGWKKTYKRNTCTTHIFSFWIIDSKLLSKKDTQTRIYSILPSHIIIANFKLKLANSLNKSPYILSTIKYSIT